MTLSRLQDFLKSHSTSTTSYIITVAVIHADNPSIFSYKNPIPLIPSGYFTLMDNPFNHHLPRSPILDKSDLATKSM